jgi:hypothetical protein
MRAAHHHDATTPACPDAGEHAIDRGASVHEVHDIRVNEPLVDDLVDDVDRRDHRSPPPPSLGSAIRNAADAEDQRRR